MYIRKYDSLKCAESFSPIASSIYWGQKLNKTGIKTFFTKTKLMNIINMNFCKYFKTIIYGTDYILKNKSNFTLDRIKLPASPYAST